MTAKKEICGATAEIVKDMPMIREVFYGEKQTVDILQYDWRYVKLGVATCELLKGHNGMHSTSKVKDFFKSIKW